MRAQAEILDSILFLVLVSASSILLLSASTNPISIQAELNYRASEYSQLILQGLIDTKIDEFCYNETLCWDGIAPGICLNGIALRENKCDHHRSLGELIWDALSSQLKSELISELGIQLRSDRVSNLIKALNEYLNSSIHGYRYNLSSRLKYTDISLALGPDAPSDAAWTGIELGFSQGLNVISDELERTLGYLIWHELMLKSKPVNISLMDSKLEFHPNQSLDEIRKEIGKPLEHWMDMMEDRLKILSSNRMELRLGIWR